ncbi:MAG TPA: phage holin family protein [Kofleriaceae bacterium]
MATPDHGLMTVLAKIGHDFKTIVVRETELGHMAISQELKLSIEKVAIALLAAMVASVGLALLCMTVAAALAPVIPQLWLRILIMSIVYLACGAFGVWRVAKLHSRSTVTIDEVVSEARQVATAVKDGLKD